MANDNIEVVVRPEGFEEITGLISILSDVAEQATKVVKSYEDSAFDDVDFISPIEELKVRLVALNDYVDEHLDDE
jgi:hypothetical protein